MVVLEIKSIGIVAANMADYIRWVNTQSKDSNRRYFPILNAGHATSKFDEIVITTTASINPNYFDIYVKLNGAYTKAKREPKESL